MGQVLGFVRIMGQILGLLSGRRGMDPGHTRSGDNLTDHQIENLAQIIVSKHMATVAIKYLDLSPETIENITSARRGDYISINRDVLTLWRNKNPGINQIRVSTIFVNTFGIQNIFQVLFSLFQ